MKPKVLVDLSLSLLSNSGIPLDTKWLFKQLAHSSQVEAFGLVYPGDDRTDRFSIGRGFEKYKDLKYSQYLALLSDIRQNNVGFSENNFFLRKVKKLQRIFKLYLKRNFELKEIENKDFNDVIFRLFFESGLSYSDREMIESKTFYLTDLFRYLVYARTMSSIPSITPYLNTKGFDYIVNQDSVPIKLPKQTKQIVRYHDPIPLMDPDYFANSVANATNHYMGIQKCIQNGAIYVCNSKPVEEELLKLFPKLNGRITTIPYTISDVYKPSYDFEKLFDILESKYSSKFLKYLPSWKKSIDEGRKDPKKFMYITEAATIEPRKNYSKLLKAFVMAKSKLKKENIDLKLVIAGSLGWRYDGLLKEIEPLLEKGDVALMDNLHPNELKYVFSHAQAFMSPSVSEGFGLPPVEAMLCKTPVIASDIKVHRWVQGDASFYVDPYNYEEIGEKIFYVVKNKNSSDTLNRIDKGFKTASKYNSSDNEKKWNQLFEDLRNGSYSTKN